MPVYHHLILYARRVTGQGRTIQYFDLVQVGDQYGVFDQTTSDGGTWRETFDEAEALARLQGWEHRERHPGEPRTPVSYITKAGRQWLASVT